MTNINKINKLQKSILAEFMEEHSDLAQNILPTCGQGRGTSDKLWKNLAHRLNSNGPPIKDIKTWKKVFADQKYLAKKRILLNKAPKAITKAHELIIKACGLDLDLEGSVENLSNVRTEDIDAFSTSLTFDGSTLGSTSAKNITPPHEQSDDDDILFADNAEYLEEFELHMLKNKKNKSKNKTKLMGKTHRNELKEMLEDKLNELIQMQKERLDIEKRRIKNEEKIQKERLEMEKRRIKNEEKVMRMLARLS